MTAHVSTPGWPSDPEHRDAIGTLLEMAEAENRWGDRRRATNLLDNVEQIVGTLPSPYAQMRSRSREANRRRPVA